MREKIANYIYDETIPFVFMGLDHVISIIVFTILLFTIPYLAKKNLNEDQQYFLGKIIGVLILQLSFLENIVDLHQGFFVLDMVSKVKVWQIL